MRFQVVVHGLARGGRGARLQDVFDSIEERFSDARLALQRQRLFAIFTNDRHRVGVDVEAGAGRADVVGDDQVEVLLLELLGGVGEQVLALGREADADEVAGRLGQDVGVGDELDRQAGGRRARLRRRGWCRCRNRSPRS
jgi:hypothetical protein